MFYYSDFENIKKSTTCASVMVARGVQWNASVFRKDGMLPLYTVVNSYLEECERLGNKWANTKYCMLEMIKGHVGAEPEYQTVVRTKSANEFRQVFPSLSQFPSITGEYSSPLKHYAPRPTAEEQAKEQRAISGSRAKHDRKRRKREKPPDAKKETKAE